MTLSPNEDLLIAGLKTVSDWEKFRDTLKGNVPENWETAFNDFFFVRLDSRYFQPIKAIRENGNLSGEGFSIVAIQCALIEFLESTIQGKIYRYRRQGEVSGDHEYSRSEEIFIEFLCSRPPFRQTFNRTVAKEFYQSDRCGLLHEARTKNGWKIRADGPNDSIIDETGRILYRNNFQKAIERFLEWYRQQLISTTAIQEAFIRKFNSLCD